MCFYICLCETESYLEHLCLVPCSRFYGLQESMLEVEASRRLNAAQQENCSHNLPEDHVTTLILTEAHGADLTGVI